MNEQNSLSEYKPRVLFVEDDHAEIFLLERTIEAQQLPYQIDIKRSATECLDNFRPQQYFLMISDFGLTDMSIRIFLDKVLQQAPDIYVVVMSNLFLKKQVEQLQAMGVKECVVKTTPMDIMKLINRVYQQRFSIAS